MALSGSVDITRTCLLLVSRFEQLAVHKYTYHGPDGRTLSLFFGRP
jgi:hypothetical protein